MVELATKLLSGVWGYVVAAALSASIAAYGAYQVTAWGKDETINAMKLADAQSIIVAGNVARADQVKRDAITAAANKAQAFNEGKSQAVTVTIIQKVPVYVQKSVLDSCLDNSIVKLLDAAGTGQANPDALPGAATEPNDACSGVSVRQGLPLLIQALGERKAFADRLVNAGTWATSQRAQNE